MPIYEYRCASCRRRTSVFVRSATSAARPKCEHCGSAKLNRLVSKFAVHRPGADFDDPSSAEDLDESDPRAVARWARKMKEEAGEDLGPEFDDMVDRIEAGEDPEGVMADSALYDQGMDDGDDF